MSKARKQQRIHTLMADGERVMSAHFRTTPIKETMTHVDGLHRSAILYKCEASSYWQFRVFLEHKTRKRSTQEAALETAKTKCKLIYAQMLNEINGSERTMEPTARNTLQTVADALWRKNELRVANKELHKDKVSKDKYVYEKHIKPFFKVYSVRDIDTDALEHFREYLTEKELATATQKSYMNIIIALLKEAHLKRYITSVPQAPRIRVDDNPRGYFAATDYTKLWGSSLRGVGKAVLGADWKASGRARVLSGRDARHRSFPASPWSFVAVDGDAQRVRCRGAPARFVPGFSARQPVRLR